MHMLLCATHQVRRAALPTQPNCTRSSLALAFSTPSFGAYLAPLLVILNTLQHQATLLCCGVCATCVTA